MADLDAELSMRLATVARLARIGTPEACRELADLTTRILEAEHSQRRSALTQRIAGGQSRGIKDDQLAKLVRPLAASDLTNRELAERLVDRPGCFDMSPDYLAKRIGPVRRKIRDFPLLSKRKPAA